MRLFDVFKNETSRPVKFAVIGGGLLVLFILIGLAVGLAWHFSSSAYEKREAKREQERQQLQLEKEQLQAEKQAALNEALEARAVAEAAKAIAESKRADRVETIKELEKIEAEREVQKANESTIDAMDSRDLIAELCRRMRERGKPCPE